VAAGVRRIEAVTGTGAYEHYRAVQDTLERLLQTLNIGPAQAADAVERLQTEVKRLTRELQDARVKAAIGSGAAGEAEGGVTIQGATLIRRRVEGLDKAALRTLADTLKAGVGSGVVVLASEADGRVALVVSVTKDLTARVKAGDLVRQLAPIVGGGGGGRPEFAEAGGKDPARIADLLAESRTVVERMLGTGGEEVSAR
jgi:alanyl-tRNA synthetase